MNKYGRVVAISILLIINMVCAYFMFVNGNDYIYKENGPMENLQAILLVISCIVFLTSSLHLEKHQKLVLLSCFLLCFSFLLREIDIEAFDIHSFLILIGSGVGRNIMLSIAWICIAIYAGFNYRYYRGKLGLYILSETGILLMIGAAFFIVGDLFDRKIIKVTYNTFYEELAELNGYYFILWGALVSRSSLQGITNRSS